jgi:hypothetical protein
VDRQIVEATRLWVLAQPAVAAFLSTVVRDFRERDDVLQDVAVAVNGIPIFNPLNNRGEDSFCDR